MSDPTQREAIDAARADGPGQVHVLGAPDEPMRNDERFCTAPDAADAPVLFHVPCVMVEYAFGLVCTRCGESDVIDEDTKGEGDA